MNVPSDTAHAADTVPSPALANTRREATRARRVRSCNLSASPRFDGLLQSAWRRAASRGFVPGEQREYLLEGELGRAAGRR